MPRKPFKIDPAKALELSEQGKTLDQIRDTLAPGSTRQAAWRAVQSAKRDRLIDDYLARGGEIKRRQNGSACQITS